MNAFVEYLIQNWSLILILLAFVIMLQITVFLDKKTVIRMYMLIVAVFLLSIIVFTEFYLAELGEYKEVRLVMMSIRYSATPVIIAMIIFALVKRAHWYVFAPCVVVIAINIVSIFTGIVFSIADSGDIKRGLLGYLPYIAVGLYSVVLVYILVKQSTKQASEIIPIVFLALSIGSGLVLPFVFKKDYSKIFCPTLAIALFVYYVFLILQLTKKDALTGLLNRQAYYALVNSNPKDVTACVSIDMNGLKTINDTNGHLAGDEALTTLALCFTKAAKVKQLVYRLGGDEFIILCRKTSEEELVSLVSNIKSYVSDTAYSCSVGYSYSSDGSKSLADMTKESDVMMYADKAKYYSKTGKDRRAN